jgi:hypothetical protein
MDFVAFDVEAVRLWNSIPASFREGVSALCIEPDAHFDPEFPDVCLMGECMSDATAAIPGAPVQSLIYIYHGSFARSARRDPSFDWDAELWETLTHELLHHLEWRAGYDALGDEDDLQRENLARRAGGTFERDYYRRGARLDEGVWTVDGDLFLEVKIPRAQWLDLFQEGLELSWGGLVVRVAPVPRAALEQPVLFVEPDVELHDDVLLPWYDVVVVLRRKGLWGGWR